MKAIQPRSFTVSKLPVLISAWHHIASGLSDVWRIAYTRAESDKESRALDDNPSKVSRHLAQLRACGFVNTSSTYRISFGFAYGRCVSRSSSVSPLRTALWPHRTNCSRRALFSRFSRSTRASNRRTRSRAFSNSTAP